ncbi:MAG: tetratricopeptide repeat protein [Sulfurospirillum sp.]|nr:tetratricopeptide repeat protein [Sulfurospirillum sp.]
MQLVANEPSAYSAGDLDSKNPYGLTSSEQRILKNKQMLENLDKKVNSISLQFSKISENYEGIRSVNEAINTKIAKIDQKIFDLALKSDTNISVLQTQISALTEEMQNSKEIQNSNQESIKIALGELSSLIDSINTSYVSKASFDKLAKIVASLQSKPVQQSSPNTSGVSGIQLLEQASKAFEKNELDKAKYLFEELVQRNYKPAYSSFHLGEIAYKQTKYTDAIAYYKKSIALYDKASYIPTLLYHTGISLSKLKQNTESKKFFDALKNNYPDSKEAKSLQ